MWKAENSGRTVDFSECMAADHTLRRQANSGSWVGSGQTSGCLRPRAWSLAPLSREEKDVERLCSG